jgi:hypothetical protein
MKKKIFLSLSSPFKTRKKETKTYKEYKNTGREGERKKISHCQ